jgi:hypothetical protein
MYTCFIIRQNLQISSVKEEIHHLSSQYSTRLNSHPNNLRVNLMQNQKQGDCEDTCPLICEPDSLCNCSIL